MKRLKHPLMALLVCTCCLVPVLAPPALAQQNSQEQITLALDDADIRDLIIWAQEVINKSIIIHPNVKGKVTVMAGDPMTRGEAYQVFLSVLQVHGFTVVESGNVLKVIPDALAKQNSVPLVDVSSPDAAEEIQVQIIKVQNISVAQLANLLRPLVPQVGHLAAYPATNSLIIADRSNNIQKIVDIVTRLDKVGVVDIELITLQFASAKEVVEVLNKLLVPAQRGNNAEAQELQLAVDERSNSILLTGDPAARIQIRKLVARLDQPLSGDGNTQVFYLNYTNAEEMVPILESVAGNLQKSQKDKATADAEIGVKASESLNALVITAPPSVLNTMKGVIARLDKRRAQVLVEALIVEVKEDVTEDFGIEWWGRNTDTSGGFRSFQGTRLGTTLQDGLDGSGGGFALGYFRGSSLRALINALSGETNVNILSTPTIMALDNEEAEILVGSNVPFKQGSQLRDGNNDPFVTFERQDIGVTLKVKPRVNNNDSVTLEIEQSVESIVPAPPGGNTDDGIITDKREIKTRVLIDNDQILVLGGLIRDELTQAESKVPLLGSIPGLGRLFRSTQTKTIKSNLMVFIHPVILPDPDSSLDASRERYERIQQSQQEFRGKIESYFVPRAIPELPGLPEPEPRTYTAPEPQSGELNND
ncbi:MAG: type II secretion system secretin GspD [Gammaproteobacteria bacterium]|uniref:type II secretion system secretin GspD n=1 Tax=Pseudomaricurvus alcaniphilus TaxID=1166482 RepID=UPI001407EB21|nr:type II secretion system secretin GspD [Pseudomaricurvus alcaniphilus]MBR9912696.1 type II secretion system secretin GspD [Gammaproteobacteria bacterium]NHN38926.1 type II secretion system secretin GspD [Pseudomaricurvus alcaniphilus]